MLALEGTTLALVVTEAKYNMWSTNTNQMGPQTTQLNATQMSLELTLLPSWKMKLWLQKTKKKEEKGFETEVY